ncbi:COX assembly mitochondrial protein homolog isoform X1 [Parus major]|uniref:COX assembly mitochondrial protein homolog isoform X1 n=1 Tax=Parus major TaxID=9157 RepID=UPI0008F4CE49|nr:COX assembly mitochondrial protein homolog isoform X1 [Parus major]
MPPRTGLAFLATRALLAHIQLAIHHDQHFLQCCSPDAFSPVCLYIQNCSIPENSKLRHVEKDVLIPQIMRDRAKVLCSDKVQAFTKCCQETGVLMVVKCRQENTALKDCLVGYYSDPSFYEECKAEYLKQREEYRATGIKKKRQKFTQNV